MRSTWGPTFFLFSNFEFDQWPPQGQPKSWKFKKKGQHFQKMQFFTKISIFLVEFDVFLIYFRLLVNTGYDLTINMYLTGSKLKFLGLDTYFHQKSWFSLKLSFWAKSPQELKKSPKSRKKMFQRTFSINYESIFMHELMLSINPLLLSYYSVVVFILNCFE